MKNIDYIMEFGNMKVEVMLMKKLMVMFLCLVLGLAFGYAMHQPKTVTRTKKWLNEKHRSFLQRRGHSQKSCQLFPQSY